MISASSHSTLRPNADALGRAAAARAWTYGWALSRSTQAPVAFPGHFQVQVGKPGQAVRHILPELDRPLLERLVAEAGPGTWLKVCAARESVSPVLTRGWHVHEPEFLMSTELVASVARVAAGYRIRAETLGALTLVKIFTDAGDLAASGQAAIDGAFATFDQIVTDEAHRRKGLGRSIMAALTNAARDRGARLGVLVATEAGAALYQALGWALVSPVTAASVPHGEG